MLREDIREHLGLQDKDVVVNPVTGHVVAKGWHKSKIVEYLKSKNL